MTITLTTPRQRQAETAARLTSFTINSVTRYAEAGFDIGRVDAGEFAETSKRKLIFQDNPNGPGKSDIADFSFKQLIDNIPEVRDLRQAIEEAVIAFNVFDGVVT